MAPHRQQSGPLLGIAPTGKPVSIAGIDHFVNRHGRVVSNFVVFDQMQYARQIGMMPPDASAGDQASRRRSTRARRSPR